LKRGLSGVSEYFLIPGFVCLAVFWRAPFVWFRTDDFAWLGLPLEVHGFRSLMRVLFLPEAQGTVRVLSERVFFLVFSWIFGVHAAPFRWFGLVTWIGALGLAAALGSRIAGSRVAGIVAAIAWTTSFAVAVPMMWSAAYNQVLCAFLLLAALYARARWLESGGTRWRILEWAAYLAAFGAIELAVMYPAAALLYTWLIAKRTDRAAWALLIPAATFGVLQSFVIPHPAEGAYRTAVDGRLPSTLLTYTLNAFGPGGYPGRWILAAALIAFVIWKIVRKDWRVLFPVAWFLLFLAPVLPLPDHILTFFLTIPLIGIAWIAGWAVDDAFRRGSYARIAAIALIAVFLAGSLPQINTETSDWLRRTSRMRLLFRGAQSEAAAHPGAALIFKDVDKELYESGFEDEPFRLFGVTRVYLAPGSGIGNAKFHISQDDAARLIASGEAVIVEAPSTAQ